VRKRKAKRQVDDDQVNNDASRAPEPDNLTEAQAEARPEATETEAAPSHEEATAETEATKQAADAEAEATEPGERQDGAPSEDAEAPADEEADVPDAAAAEAPETVKTADTTGAEAPEAEAPEAEAPAAPAAAEQAEAAEGQPDEEAEAAEAEPDSVEDPGEAVVAELVAARAEAESYLDDLRRLQAEFDNYRKRTMREQTARIASASQALVAKLLPVLDNFELAVSHAEQSRDFDRMLKGVEMVFGELREVLSNEGLVSIESEGKPFDPERHEAVVAVEQDGAEPGTVVDVIRKGYEFNGRVLRPAMVKVAR
jgi:molecular chaperone GrpE